MTRNIIEIITKDTDNKLVSLFIDTNVIAGIKDVERSYVKGKNYGEYVPILIIKLVLQIPFGQDNTFSIPTWFNENADVKMGKLRQDLIDIWSGKSQKTKLSIEDYS